MVHYLGYPTSKTAMLFYVSHYRIRLLKQLYLLGCGYNFRGASYFVWLTLFIAKVPGIFLQLLLSHRLVLLLLACLYMLC